MQKSIYEESEEHLEHRSTKYPAQCALTDEQSKTAGHIAAIREIVAQKLHVTAEWYGP